MSRFAWEPVRVLGGAARHYISIRRRKKSFFPHFKPRFTPGESLCESPLESIEIREHTGKEEGVSVFLTDTPLKNSYIKTDS